MEKVLTKKQSSEKTRILTRIAILTALGTILYKLEIPLMVAHHKIDPSLIPSLVGGLTLGPIYGVVIELLKNLIDLPTSTSAGIGQLINVLVGASVIIPISVIYRKYNTIKSYLIGFVISMISILTVGAVCNYILTPPYLAVLGLPEPSHAEIMGFVIASFTLNALKGVFTLGLTYFMLPVLRKIKF